LAGNPPELPDLSGRIRCFGQKKERNGWGPKIGEDPYFTFVITLTLVQE
jgi:hypothetical protein